MNLFNDNNDTDTIDIPDFVEDKDATTSSSVDMSIFKMSDEELYDDVPEEGKGDEKISHKKKSNSTLILCLILVAILLLISTVSIIYGLKQHSKVSTLETELSQVKAQNTDLQNQVATLNGDISTLNGRLKELQEGGAKTDPDNKYPSGTVLYITETGGSMGVRVAPKEDAEKTDITLYWGDKVTLIDNAVVDDDGNYWGKIDDGYIKIVYDGEEWASTEQQ